MKKEDKIILMSDNGAAEYRTDIKGWVSRGKYFGGNEGAARNHGSTHCVCAECGAVFEKKHRNLCPSCFVKFRQKQWDKAAKIEWDEETPIYSESTDSYYRDWDEVLDDAKEENVALGEMMLYLCKPCAPRYIDVELILDGCYEYAMLSTEALDSIRALNCILEKETRLGYQQTNKAILIPEELVNEQR